MASPCGSTHLLLLPPPPQPTTYPSLQAAYTTPLTALLIQLSSSLRQLTSRCTLDIALPCPFLAHTNKPRSTLYARTQPLVAGIYKLLCVIAAKESVNIEDAEGIDVRVILLAYPGPDEVRTSDMPDAGSGNLVDTVINLQTLARSRRSWRCVYTVESEEGEKMLQQFLISQDGRMVTKRVPGGVVTVDESAGQRAEAEDESEKAETAAQEHYSVACGGTFDHIHLGHKLLLTMFAFMLAARSDDKDEKSITRSLTIGITGDELLKNKKYAELLESWDDRARIVGDFMRGIMDFRPSPGDEIKTETKNDEGPNGRAIHTYIGDVVIRCVELSDPFGPTITDEAVSALVVSAETRGGGKAINDKRKEKGWNKLEVNEVDVLDASEDTETAGEKDSFDAKLSSTTIRKMLSERKDKDCKNPP